MAGERDTPPRATSLTDWLRSRADGDLVRLLRLRPDLALPAPADIPALAARVGVRSSTQRAVDGLSAPALRLLETLVLAAGPDDAVDDPPAAGLAALFDLALVWGDPDLVHLSPTVRESVGPYPAGLGRPAATLFAAVPELHIVPVLRGLGLPVAGQPKAAAALAARLSDPAQVGALIDAVDDAERDILRRLAAGPPVGSVRNTRLAASGDAASAAHQLMARGLLAPIDSQRVELPREIALVLRERADDGDAADVGAPPQPELVTRAPDELDRLGSTAVLELIRLVDALADEWTAQPPALLRAGGVGVRDLRRTARALRVDEPAAALIAEVAYAAGLVNATNGIEPVFLPSTEYDVWRGREPAQRWTALASAWLAMTRQPSLVNQRGERDRVISALGPDVERGTLPATRRQVLAALAQLPPGAAPADRADVLALLAWQQPRRASGQRQLAEAVLAEADALGVTAAGGLPGYTRTLLAGSAAPAEHALSRALPEPVDHFLVQPDLTVIVPGPPEPRMGVELATLADLESTGGASAYRITERTVRRALDSGRTGAQLAAFIAQHSRTPVPQALSYLIDDAARRHGVLRSGAASAYLRCDDEALLARVLADRAADGLRLRRVAPTVLVSEAPVAQVLEVLRDAGFAPAAEAPGGELITLGIEAARAPSRPASRPLVSRTAAGTDGQLAELVRRLRAGDAVSELGRRMQSIAAQVPGVTSAAIMDLLRSAVREERTVWLGCAEPDGTSTAHELTPISLAAGYVRGYERGKAQLSAFPVHRITSVQLAGEDDD
ncbi:helicase-associated domain-containing protein [uncultured Jatrophihabitans sp.]|uniref:helicase-associated domain-containing protein n=1 Tax=uncultured Jatrophihabitans sp. TaxID=1610747 RepID=UPI0035C9522F